MGVDDVAERTTRSTYAFRSLVAMPRAMNRRRHTCRDTDWSLSQGGQDERAGLREAERYDGVVLYDGCQTVDGLVTTEPTATASS